MIQDNFLPFQPYGDERLQLARFTSLDRLEDVHERKPDKSGILSGPVIYMHDMIMLPQSLAPIVLANTSIALGVILQAYTESVTIFGCYGDDSSSDPDKESYYDIGLELAIANVMEHDADHHSVLLQARRRVKILNFLVKNDDFQIQAELISDKHRKTQQLTALMRTVSKDYHKYAEMVEFINEDVTTFIENTENPGELADFIASTLELPLDSRLSFLLETDGTVRLHNIHLALRNEIKLLQLEADIQSQVQTELDKSQREIYLREQITQLQKELDDGKSADPDVQKISDALDQTEMPDEVREQALKELEHLKGTPALSPESGMLQSYLRWLIELPWTQETQDNLDVRHAQAILEQNHHGLLKAKDRILEYIAVQNLKPKRNRQPILCFVGPPGTGKTSLGKSIATAIEKHFVRVSLGGVHDEAEIRGHRRTYISALPGRIIQTMRKAKVVNPLFMLDEIDKLSADFQGDPSAALLEVLDPEQNFAFSDHYLEVPYDLSKVLFITTANSVVNIPPALLDRMEVIEFPGYIEEEKIIIANQFLIPKQLEETGLEGESITIQKEALSTIIQGYTYEAGVRNLEREIGSVLRKVARAKSEGKAIPQKITAEDIQGYLGPVEFFTTLAEGTDEIGVATAIAWTENGGEIMPVEVLVIAGKGNLQITGQIGEIMQESAQAALSYLKSRSEAFQISEDFFEDVDVHIHIPEGAIPKDGPSAGITLATALTSAILGVPVHHEVAMTGEITLRGRVLPVGGVREKVLAAHRSGIKTILLPRKNAKDLVEVPELILKELEIILVDHMDEVLAHALLGKPINAKPAKPATNSRKKKSTSKTSDVPESSE
ncbi:MAG: endopeptidase La [Anaerolineaceae bacterium]